MQKDVQILNSTERKNKVNNNDRRVKRTKKNLKEALFKLLETKSPNQISVTELTELADVNRATFYFYYTDIFDMIEQIKTEFLDNFGEFVATEPDNTTQSLSEYFCGLFTLCYENSDICKFIIVNDTQNRLKDRFAEILAAVVPISTAVFPETDPRRYLTSFMLSAVMGVMFDWLNDGMKARPEELSEFVAGLFADGAIRTKSDYERIIASRQIK